VHYSFSDRPITQPNLKCLNNPQHVNL
jgi:hypothetical protein